MLSCSANRVYDVKIRVVTESSAIHGTVSSHLATTLLTDLLNIIRDIFLLWLQNTCKVDTVHAIKTVRLVL